MSTHELAEGVFQVSLVPGINSWVIADDDGLTLVDAGLRRTAGRLVRTLRRLGFGVDDVRRVLLTHCHPDHTGAVAHVLKRSADGVEVHAGEADVPTIRGERPQPPADTATLPGRVYNLLPSFLRGGEAPPVPSVESLPPTHDPFPVGGGCVPVPTPGHTPGHVAFHLPARDLVLGGDVVFNYFRLALAPSLSCWSLPVNALSVRTLADLEPGTLALAHGAPVTDDVAGRLRSLVDD